MTADRREQIRPEELARLHTELALRLRPVCADMAPDEFEALVREVARVKVKYDLPASDRL